METPFAADCRGAYVEEVSGGPAAPIILVVDDNPMNVKLLRFVLEARGYVIRAAHSAEEAMRALEASAPDLILMDIQLPGTDGLTLSRHLRADPRHARTPIVAVSASAMPQDHAAALEAGCDEFVAKPIDTRTFGATVERLLAAANRLPD